LIIDENRAEDYVANALDYTFYAYYGMHFIESENIVTYFNNNSITS